MPKLRADMEEFWASSEVGDWAFVDSSTQPDRYIAIRLPDREDSPTICVLPIATPDQPDGPSWQWDGNREAPTLSPSILHHSNPPWHGFLQAGVLVEA